MEMINEENLETYINKNKHKKLLDNFLDIHENIIAFSKDTYSSIKSNYISIFIYHAVENKTDKNEFREFIKHLFSTDKYSKDLNFYRIFEDSDDLCLWEFVEDKRESDIWNKSSFLFLDTNKEKETIFYDVHKAYLKIILEEVNINSIKAIQESRLDFIFYNMAKNLHLAKDIIDIIDNKDIYNYELGNEFKSFRYKILNLVDYFEEAHKDELNAFKKVIQETKSFYKIFEKNLLKIEIKNKGGSTHDSYEFKMNSDYSCLQFIEHYGVEKSIDFIDYQYKKLLWTLNDYSSIDSLASSIDYIMIYDYKNLKFDIDYSKIDTSKEFEYNWIYILATYQQLVQNKEVPDDIIMYLKNGIEKHRNHDSRLSWTVIHALNENSAVDYPPMDKLIERIILQNSIPNNNNKSSKIKI